MKPEKVREVCEKESSVPAEDVVDFGSVSKGTRGYTLGHYYDGQNGLWG